MTGAVAASGAEFASPEAAGPDAVGTSASTPAILPSPAEASLHTAVNTCRFRDPEDGQCHPSADAADLAWLRRTNYVPPGQQTAELLPIEDDPDDPDEEDGGALALVDPPGNRSAPTAEELLSDPGKPSFWKSLAKRVTDLVVRKSDSRPVSLPEEELAELFAFGFPMPLEEFPPEKLKDSFYNSRGRHRKHHAIDLPAPRGTPLVAVVSGTIERLGRDKKGGKVVYLRDESGKYLFFYAHLASHEKGLKAGDHVEKGDRIGEVGSTGHVIGGPHLHFAIFRDDDQDTNWKRGLAVNPYLIFATLVPR
ncbi:MAG TPA: M23 family metallopeptidase [Thermoanaerobaculia bacterium]